MIIYEYINIMKKAVKIFKALSEPTRLRIMLLLMKRDLCVCELIFILKMAQSRVSQQLRILRDADLVEDTRDGHWIIYRATAAAREALEALFQTVLKEEIERSSEILRDAGQMDICLRQGVRQKRRSTAASSRRRAIS
jgi:DNA-binding transcriptional ArsR family regulator